VTKLDRAGLAAILIGLATVMAACSGTPAKAASTGKTVTYAEQPGSGPNYIFPY